LDAQVRRPRALRKTMSSFPSDSESGIEHVCQRSRRNAHNGYHNRCDGDGLHRRVDTPPRMLFEQRTVRQWHWKPPPRRSRPQKSKRPEPRDPMPQAARSGPANTHIARKNTRITTEKASRDAHEECTLCSRKAAARVRKAPRERASDKVEWSTISDGGSGGSPSRSPTSTTPTGATR
jgi:hypothetical protein